MCPLIRRLLFNLYGNQQFQIRWNNCLSNMYNMTNGVKQGAVLSLILFTMYIDGLFYELKRAGVGCHINGEYAGAFGYADDIVLLSPSLCALKHSITLCEDYAKRFKILFNPIKSKLMCFNVKHKDFVLYLCNQPVNLVEHETYLGHLSKSKSLGDKGQGRLTQDKTIKFQHYYTGLYFLLDCSTLSSIFFLGLVSSKLY